jgi:hypothetical protein
MARSTESGGNGFSTTAEPDPESADLSESEQPVETRDAKSAIAVNRRTAEIRSLHPMSVVYGLGCGMASVQSPTDSGSVSCEAVKGRTSQPPTLTIRGSSARERSISSDVAA